MAARRATETARQLAILEEDVTSSQDTESTATQILVPPTQTSDVDVSLSQQSLAHAFPWPATQPQGDEEDEEDKEREDESTEEEGSEGEGGKEKRRAPEDAEQKKIETQQIPVDTQEQAEVDEQAHAKDQDAHKAGVPPDDADEDAAGETEVSENEEEKGGASMYEQQVDVEDEEGQSGDKGKDQMSTGGAPIETESRKSKGKTSSTDVPAGRSTGRARGTRRGRQSADAAKSGENLDDEGLIKTVQKKGKKKEEGTLEETIGTEMERVMRASQFGWSRVPCIRARHLQSKSFTVKAYDKLQRNISKAGVQHLYEKAKDPAQGLLTTVTDHALDIIIDRALVDPASFTSDPSKLTDILRPVLGLEPSLAIAFLLAGHYRLEALKRYWLELANAADEASITWTDKTRKLLNTRGTWLVRLWDKQRLESSVWGPAIIQKLRSNDLTAQRPDTPTRKAATLAASIDTRNVDAIRAAMFTTLHINKAKDAFHNVMGNFCATRNLLVDMVKDPA